MCKLAELALLQRTGRSASTLALLDLSLHRAQHFVEEVLQLVELAPLRNMRAVRSKPY